jgi:hypothetical protein
MGLRGTWRAICDRCGFEFASDKLRKEWTGLMTCGACWEPRHPQDFVRVKVDHQTPPWTRPEAADTFVAYCTIAGSSAYAGLAVAGCAISGNIQQSASWLMDNFAPEALSVTPALEVLTDEFGNAIITENGEFILV